MAGLVPAIRVCVSVPASRPNHPKAASP